MSKRVAIIYLTFYDQPHYIDEAVLSVGRQTYSRDELALVVVDNSCHGPSARYVREHVLPRALQTLPETVLIENDTNTGFAEGNNIGIRWAMERGFDYVFLLNNDAKLDAHAIEEAVAIAESDAKIGAVQSLLLLWQKPDVINSSGNDIHYLGFGLTRDYGKRVEEITRRDGDEIGYASGAGVLYRVSALREVGLLEPFFWMYHEDLELGWRLRLAGWKSVFSRRSLVYHDYVFARSTDKMYWMERNRLLTHLALLRLPILLLLAPAIFLMELVVLGGALLRGWSGKKLRSLVALLSPSSVAFLLDKRRQVARLRRVSDREAIRLFVGRIEHQGESSQLLRWLVNPLFNGYWQCVKFLCALRK